MNSTGRPQRVRPWWTWAVAAPLLVLSGALAGPWLLPADLLPQPDLNADAPADRPGKPEAAPSPPVVQADPATSEGPTAFVAPSFADLVERVRDGVVRVRCERSGTEGEEVVHASGFVLDEDGYVLTNHHVVAGAHAVSVHVPGHGRHEVDVVGLDWVTDVAMLRLVAPPPDLCVLELGDSDALRPGDWVLTLGNPLQLSHTVTVGVVSTVGRHLDEDGIPVTNPYLQFSAAVRRGSSGGPVLDLSGRVVGLTTRTSPDGPGLSFAVPSKVLRSVLMCMHRDGGRVRRGYLGVSLGSSPRGVVLRRIRTGGPADVAALEAGDVVLSFEGEPVENAGEFYDRITFSRPGTVVEMQVERDGLRLAPLRVTLGEVPGSDAPAPRTAAAPRAGAPDDTQPVPTSGTVFDLERLLERPGAGAALEEERTPPDRGDGFLPAERGPDSSPPPRPTSRRET